MIMNTAVISTLAMSLWFPTTIFPTDSLHKTPYSGDMELVSKILNHNVTPDERDSSGSTALPAAMSQENEIVAQLNSQDLATKQYDRNAKLMYGENDVMAFVYDWFAGFDHQASIDVFKRHLNPERIDMYFPDFPIKSIEDFERWYNNVIDNIQWNSHRISNLKVSGDEINGFSVSLDINWKAKTYKGESYDMNIHQDWKVKVDRSRNLMIDKHRAYVIDK